MALSKMPVTKSWKDAPPSVHELAQELSQINPKNVPDYLASVCKLLGDRLWRILPSRIQVLMDSGGNWYSKDEVHSVGAGLYRNSYYDGRYIHNPYEMAERVLYYKFWFGQCPKHSHAIVVKPNEVAAQRVEFLPQETLNAINAHGTYYSQFSDVQQVGVCQYHEIGLCPTCSAKYELVKQEPRFWRSKSGECADCLKQQLMYVERKHNPKSLFVKKGGRREEIKLNEWMMEFKTIPPGPTTQPPPSVSVIPAQEYTPMINSALLFGSSSVPWNIQASTTEDHGPFPVDPEPYPEPFDDNDD